MKQFFSRLLRQVHQQSPFETVWLLAPVAVWFSYRPLIKLGRNTTTNFEVSVTLIYLCILAICGLPLVWKGRRKLLKQKAVWLVGSFVGLSCSSLLWTSDLTRGVLTAGIMGLLFIIFLASVAKADHLKQLLPLLGKVFIVTAVIMSLLSFIQLFAGIWLGHQQPLLCPGCTANQFGFVRPNVFTAEPQFFGNLLLAPALILFYRLGYKKWQRAAAFSFFIIVTALFLTLSRGSIFAFGLGVIILVIPQLPPLKTTLSLTGILLASFLVCLGLQGTAAALNPHMDTSFREAITASVNQLSLGVIDIPPKTSSPGSSVTPLVSSLAAITPRKVATTETTANFDGYVAESTNVRLELSRLALQSWKMSPQRMVFGVGIGGSGATLRQEFPSQVNDREIVQNEYVKTLYENGLLGLGLFLLILGLLLLSLRLVGAGWLQALIVAFVVQWNFFSGYPNALHIYFILILLGVVIISKNRKVTGLN